MTTRTASRIVLTAALLAVVAGTLAAAPAALAGDETKKVKVFVSEGGKDKDVIINLAEGEPLAWAYASGGKRGFLGVQLVEATPELRTWLGAPDKAGVLVGQVKSDSPAAKAGVKVGDLIVAIDKNDMENSWDVRQAVRDHQDGDVVSLEIWRDRRVMTLPVTIAVQESAEMDIRELMISPSGLPSPLFKFDAEKYGDLARRLKEGLDRPELKERLLQVQERRGEMEKRIKELEERLREMEEKLKTLR